MSSLEQGIFSGIDCVLGLRRAMHERGMGFVWLSGFDFKRMHAVVHCTSEMD